MPIKLIKKKKKKKKIVTRSLHANQIRILSSTSQTTDANRAEIILNAPVIVSHNEGMKYLLKIQEALI